MNAENTSPTLAPFDDRGTAAPFLARGGEMGALIRSIDWARTPLGPVSAWPQSLRTSLSICLSSQFPILLWWGPELVMLYNDAYRPMTGEKHPRSMGQPGLEAWAEIRDVIEPMLRRVLTEGEATWAEDLMLPIVRQNVAEEAYFTFTYSPIRDESGGVGGVFCAVVETTERVIEERRLRLLNALADATQAKTPAEACMIAAAQLAQAPSDVPFALLYLQDEASTATLAGAANVESGSPRAPRSIRSGDRSPWPFNEAMAQGGPLLLALENGPEGAQEAVILPIERSGGGRPWGVLVVGLSPLLRRSRSYDRFHNLLAASLSQSVSNAAAYEQERKQAEALAAIDRAKTVFFSNVSHEFRTPLTLMLAPIQDMLGLPPGASVDRPSVELLHRNALRLLKLVNTLLEFSRIEAGRMEAAYEPLDLSAITAELASGFRSAAERLDLALVVDCPPLPELVYLDRDMWEKIVLNLLSNALKFTFEGSITVRTRLGVESALLEVSDTGTGIAEEEMPRLFERFHRIEGARSRSHEGSGIGLALLHDLVRLHGGQVAVTSRVGQGTTFSVSLPRGGAHLPPASLRAARSLVPPKLGAEGYLEEALRWGQPLEASNTLSERSAPASQGSEPSTRILYADDNADMRDYVARLLGERWVVETVPDGAAALASLRRRAPDLVLCDVMMPVLDGFALLKAVRADADLHTLPVILLSARAGEEATGEGLSLGANDYIVKPFSARDLLVRVASMLARARATKEWRAKEEAQRVNLYRHFMQAPFFIAVFRGPNHLIDLANPPTLRVWGKGPEILGLPLAMAMPELQGQPFLGWLDDVFRTGVAHEGRAELARLPTGPKGELEDIYSNFVYAPLRDESGAVEGVLLSAFDVTEQVLARRTLEQALAERASALAAAEQTSRAKDEFLATLSHELRTPLNAMLGWSTMLKNDPRDDIKLDRGLSVIERNAKTQARLIDDLLDVSRIISGKLRLSVKKTEVSAVIYAALDVVRQAAEAKGVRLIVDLDPDVGTLVADPDRLQQIVWNLLINAVKFTRPRGSIRVTATRVDSAVCVRVQDTGLGIPPEYLPFIFDRFRQIDGSTTRAHGGLGLGLAIVRHLAEAHGGSVKAESEGTGKGATFTVTLPIHAVYTPEGEAAPSTDVKKEPGRLLGKGIALRGRRVLVVDDDEDSVDLLRAVFESEGALVTSAQSARDAIEQTVQTTFDVIISDIGMPEMDGYTFMRRVRSQEKGGDVPSIALTAYARAEDAAQARKAGYQQHLTKPVDAHALLAMVQQLLPKPSLSGQAP